MPETQYPELLRARDVLKIFGIAPRTLYDWHEKGQLRAITLPSGVKRWRKADVDRVFNQGDAK